MKPELTKFIIFCLLAIFCFTILFVSLNNDINRRSLRDDSDIFPDYFTVKEYEGKIAVYKNDEESPYIVYDAYVSLLPQQDVERLKQGIVTDNQTYLQSIIEDYTS
jgi:hypothetical protein